MPRIAAHTQPLGGASENRKQLRRRPAGETQVRPTVVVDPAAPDRCAAVVSRAPSDDFRPFEIHDTVGIGVAGGVVPVVGVPESSCVEEIPRPAPVAERTVVWTSFQNHHAFVALRRQESGHDRSRRAPADHDGVGFVRARSLVADRSRRDIGRQLGISQAADRVSRRRTVCRMPPLRKYSTSTGLSMRTIASNSTTSPFGRVAVIWTRCRGAMSCRPSTS